jgi:uncharacterized protein (DUF433 family)
VSDAIDSHYILVDTFEIQLNASEDRSMTGASQERITLNPAVLGGKPTIRGLRISVEHVFRALSNGVPPAELLEEYPDLTAEDLQACYAYAAELIESERAYRD